MSAYAISREALDGMPWRLVGSDVLLRVYGDVFVHGEQNPCDARPVEALIAGTEAATRLRRFVCAARLPDGALIVYSEPVWV